MIVTRMEQAVALQEVGFLGQFVEPASPTDVARKLGMPANLAHHHAKRHADLDLLQEVRRGSGKVYYQLTALTFKHARSLIPVGAPDERVTSTLATLEQKFLEAYERSDRLAGHQDPDWTVYGFRGRGRPEPEGVDERLAVEPRPSHLQVRTVRLSAQRYKALVGKVWRLLEEAESGATESTGVSTLAFLAMDGPLQAGEQDGQMISSFVPSPGSH